MTQKEKEELLVALYGYLPYNVIIKVCKSDNPFLGDCFMSPDWIKEVTSPFYEIKPYLRSMSTMTDDENDKLGNISYNLRDKKLFFTIEQIDWLSSHHFDYRNLIGRGLAIEAPKNMYTA